MARTFVAASSQLLGAASSPITALPATIACWLKPATTNLTPRAYFATIGKNAAGGYLALASIPSGAPAALTAEQYDGTTDGTATHGTTLSAGVWQHAAAVFASSTSRSIYLNGTGKVTDTTSVVGSLAAFNQTTVGAYRDSAASDYVNGDMAEFAVWNVALTDADVAVLALGVSPRLVRPDALVFYAPLNGAYSPEIDLVGHRDLTLTNAPAAAAHPRLFTPAPSAFTTKAPAVLSGGNMFLVF